MTASLGSDRLSPLQRAFLQALASQPSGFFVSGGAVLVGWVLEHRRTDDIVLFTTEDASMQDADRRARAIAAAIGASVEATQTSPDFRRYTYRRNADTMEVDFIRERVPQLHAKVVRDGIPMDPVEEIVANKICALVGRAQIRDLVDLYCLEGAGFRVEEFLADAHRKDGGVTPASLAWVLSEMTLPSPLPGDVDPTAVHSFVRDLEARMRRLALPQT